MRKLGCVHRRQLETLVREKFRRPDLKISAARLDAMLRQLQAGTSNIFLDNEWVCLSGARPDVLRLEAVDIMLELAEGSPADFTTRVARPAILRFSWGDDLRLFTVAELSAPVRPTVEALARQKRVVWLTENGLPCQMSSVPGGLTLPPKHFFAARSEDGFHRFYGSNRP